MVKKILLLHTRELCYYSGSYFLQQLQKALEALGVETDYFSLDEKGEVLDALLGQKYHGVVDINSKLPYFILEDDTPYLDALGAPFYNYIVDHPLYHHPGLSFPLKNYHAIGIDKNHLAYMEKYYPHLQDAHFLPMGVTKSTFVEEKSYKKRKIPLLFSGTYEPEENMRARFNLLCRSLPDKQPVEKNYDPDALYELGLALLETMMAGKRVEVELMENETELSTEKRDTKQVAERREVPDAASSENKENNIGACERKQVEIPMEEALLSLLDEEKFSQGVYGTREFPVLMNYLYFIDKYVRNARRNKVLSFVAATGLPLHVIGQGWDETDLVHQKNVTLLGSKKIAETYDILADTKRVLDVNPLFAAGLHDRVTSSMINGCYVYTDMATDVDLHFAQDNLVSFYDNWHLDALGDALFEKEDILEERAKKAMIHAKSEYSWETMAKRLLDIMR